MYLLGDISEKEYLAERTDIQNAFSVIRPTRLPDVELVAQALRDFGLIWVHGEDAERMRLLRQMIEKTYIHRGAIIAIEPRPDAYPLLMLASQCRLSPSEMMPHPNSFPVAPVSDILLYGKKVGTNDSSPFSFPNRVGYCIRGSFLVGRKWLQDT